MKRKHRTGSQISNYPLLIPLALTLFTSVLSVLGVTNTAQAQVGIRPTDLTYNPDTTARVIELRWPKTVPLPPSPPGSGVWWDTAVTRTPALVFATATYDEINGENRLTDRDWAFNTQYKYEVNYIGYQWVYNAPTNQWAVQNYPNKSTIYVTPRKVDMEVGKSVDSRLDLRFAVEKFKDYDFGPSDYRGGLFTGFNQDGSRVSRSYLKFSALPYSVSPTPEEKLWDIGGLYTYYTRNAKNGTANVNVRMSSLGWTSTSLVWTTAPAIVDPTYGLGSTSLAYNRTTFVPSWVKINSTLPLLDECLRLNYTNQSSNPFLPVLITADETTSGWSYFSKTKKPFLLYAQGGQGLRLGISSTTATMPNAGSQLGTVSLTYDAPTGGVTVKLRSGDTTILTVPDSVIVPAGSRTATFTISAGTVTLPAKTTSVTATCGASASMNITVDPAATGGGGTTGYGTTGYGTTGYGGTTGIGGPIPPTN
jgi:hypothetical protein